MMVLMRKRMTEEMQEYFESHIMEYKVEEYAQQNRWARSTENISNINEEGEREQVVVVVVVVELTVKSKSKTIILGYCETGNLEINPLAS
jgi:hypothetical protein